MEDQKSDDRKNFMKPSYQDPLKKREDFAVSLRKKKTTEIINAKRRRMYGSKSHYPIEGGYPGADGTETKNTGIYSGGSEYEKGEMYETFMNQVCPQYLVDRSLGLVDRIQLLLNALLCADLTEPQQLVLIINIRKTISGSEEPPVQEILATNILHMLGSILNAPDNNTAAVEQVRLMKLEAVWILSNLAYGTLEDIMKILSPEYGILTAVDHMMQTSDKPMLEQVLWFLGNVCGEDKKLQEIIISHTCIFAVLQSLIDTSRISRSLLRTICWVNSNIGRYRNLNGDQIRIVVAIAKAGLFCEDDSIASDSLWSIAYVADTHDDDVIETMAEQDLLNMLVSKLASADTSHFIPALRAVGNILTCSNAEVVERCLFADVISGLTGLLMQTSTPVIKEALWSFSNITAGPCTHVRAFAESNAFDRILVLSESRNLDLKKEALLVLTNAVTGADVKLRAELYDKTHANLFKQMIFALDINDVRLLMGALDSLDDLIALDAWYGSEGTSYSLTAEFERNGGLDRLEEVMKHPNMDVYNRASRLMAKYFERVPVIEAAQSTNMSDVSTTYGTVHQQQNSFMQNQYQQQNYGNSQSIFNI